MFAIVGNSPSSGSTLLADILDSTPFSICGPELNIFTNRDIYNDFNQFKINPFRSSRTSSIYTRVCKINKNNICYFMPTTHDFAEILNKSQEPSEFFEKFGNLFSRYRCKRNATWIEKTPQNVEVFSNFNELFLTTTLFIL